MKYILKYYHPKNTMRYSYFVVDQADSPTHAIEQLYDTDYNVGRIEIYETRKVRTPRKFKST